MCILDNKYIQVTVYWCIYLFYKETDIFLDVFSRRQTLRKDETLTSWTLLLLYSAITPKSEDKYVVKVFNSSEFHLSEMTCYKIHTLIDTLAFKAESVATAARTKQWGNIFWRSILISIIKCYSFPISMGTCLSVYVYIL